MFERILVKAAGCVADSFFPGFSKYNSIMPEGEFVSPIFLSVVVPAFNEEKRIGETLLRIRAFLESRLEAKKSASEIIVVDDGSTDRTSQIAAEALLGRPNDRILRRVINRGKGYSIREGILAASGGLILFTDADLSTPISEFEKLLPGILSGRDIVIGSRALPDSDVRRRQNRLREMMGKIYNALVRVIALKGIRDTQCGFKLFRRNAARDIFGRIRTDGFGFDVEALYIARALGYTIGQVPVIWINSPQSKVRIFRSSLGMIRDLLRIRRIHRELKNHGNT